MRNRMVVGLVLVAVVFCGCVEPACIHEGIIKSVENIKIPGHLFAAAQNYDIVTFTDGFVVKVYSLNSYQIGAKYRVLRSQFGTCTVEESK